MASALPDEPPHFQMFEWIMKWGEDQENVVNWAWQSRGGWEGWAQVELHTLFGYNSSREDDAYEMPPYMRARRTDLGFFDGPFFMPSNWSRVPWESVLVELKCEGAKNRANFQAGVEDDIEKIKGDIKSQWWERGGCTIYSIALSMSHDGHRELQELGMRRFNEFSDHQPPFQLWWSMNHIHPDHYSNPDLSDEQRARYTSMDEQYAGAPVSYEEGSGSFEDGLDDY